MQQNQHPALVRFAEHLGRDARCSNDKTASLVRHRRQALEQFDYIGLNQKLQFYLAFDIDREGAGIVWEQANLPPPTLSIVNPVNAHAHLLYELSAPVLPPPKGRSAPLEYAAAIKGGFHRRLDADAGFAGLMVKNPFSATWKLSANDKVYDLGELAEYLDKGDLKKVWSHNDLPQQKVIGDGRHYDLFTRLRFWAYPRAAAADSHDLWLARLLDKAEELNTYRIPLPLSSLRSTARSVAKYTWAKRFELTTRGRPTLTPEEITARQIIGGRVGGLRASGRFDNLLLANQIERVEGLKTRTPAPMDDIEQVEADLIAAIGKWQRNFGYTIDQK